MINFETLINQSISLNKLPHAIILRANPGVDLNNKLLFLVNKIGNTNFKNLNQENLSQNIYVLDYSKKELSKDNLEYVFEQLNKTPLEQNKKNILILINLENASNNFNNALLKTLEEAPENSHIIITTNNYSKIIPTIKSRTQSYYINGPTVSEKIKYISENFKTPYAAVYANAIPDIPATKKLVTKRNDVLISELYGILLEDKKWVNELILFLHKNIKKDDYEFKLNVLQVFIRLIFSNLSLGLEHETKFKNHKRKTGINFLAMNVLVDSFLKRRDSTVNFSITLEKLLIDIKKLTIPINEK
ncbi:DNA polymerase-3 subunit delta' [Mycoplasma testudineum]|uniref:DNA polymerase-3 subunit delta n=1 Tax=Mycoplasma testudineum TaxID=244584 RepID=A0A4R6IE81_9MOLU|nr:hypothetical protein [Mycoplasma testudineum]TDO20342.1 DNA polymerase-3 subunit delta' [Mycoplasma testudineum]